MSKNERENMMMAYLDGELSVAEANAFDASLNEEERERMAAELKVESAVAERLGESVLCPVELWKQLERQIQAKEVNRFEPRKALFAVAAAMLVMASAFTYWNLFSSPLPDTTIASHGVHMDMDKSLDSFAAGSETAATAADVERYLQEHGIQLAMADYSEQSPDSHHELNLLGCCEGDCPEGSLVEIRFECCKNPAKLVVAKLGTGGASMIEAAIKAGTVRDFLHIDGYVAGVVGDHHAEDLLHLLRKQPGKLA